MPSPPRAEPAALGEASELAAEAPPQAAAVAEALSPPVSVLYEVVP